MNKTFNFINSISSSFAISNVLKNWNMRKTDVNFFFLFGLDESSWHPSRPSLKASQARPYYYTGTYDDRYVRVLISN